MITRVKPYPAYKNSGVEWLGQVPAHWEMRKLRQILRQNTERNRPDLPLLSVVREKGVILRNVDNRAENHNYIPDDLSNYKVVHAGQFAINKMKAWQGSYGVSAFEGILSPAYFVFDLVGISGPYFHMSIRSQAYVPFFMQASDGVRIGQWDLSQAQMREMPFVLPPLPEQTAIVRFLDYVDRRIRRVSRARKKRINLLEEYKQVLIHQAVTGQIDVRTGRPYPAYRINPLSLDKCSTVHAYSRVFSRLCPWDQMPSFVRPSRAADAGPPAPLDRPPHAGPWPLRAKATCTWAGHVKL